MIFQFANCESLPEGIAYPKHDTHKYYIPYIVYDLHDQYCGSDFDN